MYSHVKKMLGGIVALTAVLAVRLALAQTVYVVPPDTSGHSPVLPYTNWAGAATNIQSALDEAALWHYTNIVVSNGLYTLASEITMTNAVYLRSWHNGDVDRAGTIINGADTCRGVILSNIYAVLDGVTVSNAFGNGICVDQGLARGCAVVHGGGGSAVRVNALGVLEGALIRDNQSRGIWINGGVVRGCEIVGNVSPAHGGGAYIENSGRLLDSMVSNNQMITTLSGRGGGGVFIQVSGIVSNCDIIANRALNGNAGGVHGYAGAGDIILDRCQILGNVCVSNLRGGGVYMMSGKIRNCLIAGNDSYRAGGLFLSGNTMVENCTIVSNNASNRGGSTSRWGGGIATETSGSTVINSIIYHNTCAVGSNLYGEESIFWTNNCTAPDVNGYGGNNITSAPEFMDPPAGNFRLAAHSPCVNAGTNLPWVHSPLDLDGHARADRFSGLVDIGCYEYIPRGTLYNIY